MAVRGGPGQPDLESEPVLLETDGVELTVTLDDGEEITFDAVELQLEIGLAIAGHDYDDEIRAAA